MTEVRGLLIPLSIINALPDGSLHPLFGWQSEDMAKWVRTKVGPLFDQQGNPVGSLSAWADPNGAGSNVPPYKYVMIWQAQDLIHAADPVGVGYYGIASDVSVARRTFVMVKGDHDTLNPPLDIATPGSKPGEASFVNSWATEEMRRGSSAPHQEFGNLLVGTTGGIGVGWTFTSTDFFAVDRTSIYLPEATAPESAWIELPSLPLPANQLGMIRGSTSLSVNFGDAPNRVDIALVSGTHVAAYASFNQKAPATVGSGGSIIGGPVSGSSTSSTGTERITLSALYSRLDLLCDAAAGSIELHVNGTKIAEHTTFPTAGLTIDGLYIWTASGETLYIDQMSIHSGQFRCNTPPNDSNGDGQLDEYDAVIRQSCTSGPGKPYPTGTFPSCACFDADGDFDVDDDDVFGEPAAPADFDADGDVDLTDQARLRLCRSGPMVPQLRSDCRCADLDSDGDVDQSDFGLLQACYGGPGNPPNAGCMGAR